MGDICRIYNGVSGKQVTAEVVGFKNNHMLLMPYSDMNGISAGSFVRNKRFRFFLPTLLTVDREKATMESLWPLALKKETISKQTVGELLLGVPTA